MSLKILPVLAIFAALSACGSGEPPQELAKKRANQAAAIGDGTGRPQEAPVEEEEVYTYNPIGKRDPFRSFIVGARENEIRAPTPLQQFEIDQYTLVGVVWGIDNPRAMVQDPARKGHVVELGTYIGKNWGKVTQITSTELVITEEYQTLDGELVTNQVTLDLPVNTFELQ